MRLFTTRNRRPDRLPEIRPLDLVALAGARGRILPRPVRARTADPATVAGELASTCGRSLVPVTGPWRPPEAGGAVLARVTAGRRTVSLRLDRSTRRVWLGILLGLPAGTVDDRELPAEPTPLERTLLERTLVMPFLRAIVGPESESELPIAWSLETDPPSDDSPTLVRAFETMSITLSAGCPGAPVRIRLDATLATEPLETHPELDRSLRSADLPLTVRLASDRAGLILRAGDLARLEVGDVLVTDLPAEASRALPIEAVGAFRGPEGKPSCVLRGRLGLAGAHRGVGFEPFREAPIG